MTHTPDYASCVGARQCSPPAPITGDNAGDSQRQVHYTPTETDSQPWVCDMSASGAPMESGKVFCHLCLIKCDVWTPEWNKKKYPNPESYRDPHLDSKTHRKRCGDAIGWLKHNNAPKVVQEATLKYFGQPGFDATEPDTSCPAERPGASDQVPSQIESTGPEPTEQLIPPMGWRS